VFVDETGGRSQAPQQSQSAPFVTTDPLASALFAIKDELLAARAESSAAFRGQHQGHQRSTLKTTALLEFPKGSEEALEDLDSWLQDFDRVTQHVSGNQGLMAQDRITHLLAAWPKEMDVGENMRLDQRADKYLLAERSGDMEACWSILLDRLNTYRVEPALARRKAEKQWSQLYWPGDIEALDTLMRRASTALRRNNVPKSDYDLVLRYLELLPKEKAKSLEDPLRRPAAGWLFADLQKAARDLFSLDRAYDDTGSGIPTRTRATWNNDKRMAQTPLALRAPPLAPPPFGGGGGSGGGGSSGCNMCGSQQHKQHECPNHAAKRDQQFQAKTPEFRKASVCNLCKGKGHWRKHHDAPVNRNTQAGASDPPPEPQAALSNKATSLCHDFQKGRCTRGASCRFEHSSGGGGGKGNGKGNKGGGKGNVCYQWTKYGRCKVPPNKPCQKDHPQGKKGPSVEGKAWMEKAKKMPCRFWAQGECASHQYGGCLFAHDPKLRGTQRRVQDGQEQEAPGAEVEQRRARIGETEEEDPPFVFSRASRIVTLSPTPAPRLGTQRLGNGLTDVRDDSSDEEPPLAESSDSDCDLPDPRARSRFRSSEDSSSESDLDHREFWEGLVGGSSHAEAPAPCQDVRVVDATPSRAGSSNRPTTFLLDSGEGPINRRLLPADRVYAFDKFKSRLPTVEPPPAGYCHASVLSPKGLPGVTLRVIWDTGAEGTSISDRALSRILRAQEAAQTEWANCAVTDMCRMVPAQRFFSFAEAVGSKGIEVDIMGHLVLMTADELPFPELQIRMVPGQADDLLVAAPDLDRMGFDSFSDPKSFLFRRGGVSAPRETPAAEYDFYNNSFSIAGSNVSRARLVSIETLAPHETRLVQVECVGQSGAVVEIDEEVWFEGMQGDELVAADGPLEGIHVQAQILIHNSTDEEQVVPQGTVVGHTTPLTDTTRVLSEALAQLEFEDHEAFAYGTHDDSESCVVHCSTPGQIPDLCAPDRDAGVRANGLSTSGSNRHPIPDLCAPARDAAVREWVDKREADFPGSGRSDPREAKPKTAAPARSWPRVLARWFTLVVLLLHMLPEGTPQGFATTQHQVAATDDEDSSLCHREAASAPLWTDLRCDEYLTALSDVLDKQRETRYAHLSDRRFDKLKTTLLARSLTLVVDGVEASCVTGYLFDIELKPGAQPVRHQLPKLAPLEQTNERHHVRKGEGLGHLRVPTDAQKSEWATRTHIVKKKDDPMGRWICDFRPLNRVTVKRMTPLGDVFTKTRTLASRRWKSGLDAWSGFNQMRATERAQRYMQIITSKGLRQWTVLPFGVTNGPSYFQEFMLHLYSGQNSSGSSDASPAQSVDLLTEGLADVEGILEIWVDDVQVGTGLALGPDDDGEAGFDQHLIAISRVLERAEVANLRFKLDKCFFCQFEIKTLGMVAGCGVVKPDTDKTGAIAVWPRPSRLEDVERFLATTVFLREHLSPRYSSISKPLRDILTELQTKRRNKEVRGKAKFLPPSKAKEGDAWPPFWSEEAEESFTSLKHLVINAVELVVPDFTGAADNSNPFHIWPDACAYGIGAGLFQGYGNGTLSLLDSHYSILGVPTWATKGDVDEQYRALHRSQKFHKGVDQAAVQEAYSVLADKEKRHLYDESLGLAAKRRSRIDLRPLGFFSKSLSKAQQNWPTWERELLAVLLCLLHFRTIVAGQEVVIHTDHLNNTVLGENLTSPDKILRMLLKIEGLVRPRWVFAPGSTQFGDGLSRNPEDRETAREQAEGKQHMPKTLAEAFSACAGTTLVGKPIEDDTELYTQQFQSKVVTAAPALMGWFKRGAPGSVLARAGRTSPQETPAVFLPSIVGHAQPLDQFDNYTLLGKELFIKAAITLQPPLILPTLGRKWLEEFVSPPRNKAVQRKMRFALLDGVLCLLRAIVTISVTAAFGHGEGALVLMATLSSEVRAAAYSERHVPADERVPLEDAALALTHVILLAPFCNPPRSYLPMLREYVPEVCCVIPQASTQVIVVAPLRDSLNPIAQTVASSILGSILEVVAFKGPAYRGLPPSPLALYQLRKPDLLIQVIPEGSSLPRECAETWAGDASITTELVRVGFTGRAYEFQPHGKHGDILPEGDVERPENQAELAAKISGGELYSLHLAPDCSSWSLVQNLNLTTRTLELPQGDGSLEHEKTGNRRMSIALWLIWTCIRDGVFFVMEHPLTSRVWKLPFVQYLIHVLKVFVVDLDQCAFGKRPSDWVPTQGDVRTLKPTRLLTNNPFLLALARRCADVPKHVHQQVMGSSAGGTNRSADAASYPKAMAVTYALAVRTAWLKGAKPEKKKVRSITLDKFLADVALDPATIPDPCAPARDAAVRERSVVQQPFSVERGRGSTDAAPPLGPSSVTASDLPDPDEAPLAALAPRADYWLETATQWLRLHVVPRHTYFYPYDAPAGPAKDSLSEVRVTQLVFSDKTRKTERHNWTDPRFAKAKTRLKWTGRSIFTKITAPALEAAAVVTSGSPMTPGDTPALRASLASMRSQLAAAQRRDPRLAQIIQHLKGSTAGSYLPEPRSSETRKVQKRALHYRLSSDNVVVARGEGEALGEDLPVVPDVVHESSVPDAPRNLTWKHVLLGAVHNTVTGQHRKPADMASELLSLVCWYPPEDLLGDCKRWRERCKLCTSVHNRPLHDPSLQAVVSRKPFYRLQFDLMEVKPSGVEGEKWIVTAICVATRYPFLRATTTRDAVELAKMLLDIILDAGVVPAILQSDNEFLSVAFEEFCFLLGTTQIFSTALRPQTQGIVERSHRDIRSHLAILIDAFARANPRKWPEYLRFAEHRLRHKTICPGITPYAVVHGFLGSSALQTAMGSLQEIPEDIIWADWLRGIVEETKRLSASLADHWTQQAASRARKHGEKTRTPDFQEGELVLVTRPFWEKGVAVILPQCDGPYSISRMVGSHTCLLIDPLSQEPAFDGKPVSLARLIRFRFPADWAGAEALELPSTSASFASVQIGAIVACLPRVCPPGRVFLGRVDRLYRNHTMLEVTLMHVAPAHRTGPWTARRWEVWTDSGAPRREVITADEYICTVNLREGALDLASLETLSGHGLNVSLQPRRDASLPAAGFRADRGEPP